MKAKYYQLDTELIMGTDGIKKITVLYKYENGKWYNKYPDERIWYHSDDPHNNKWPHEKTHKRRKHPPLPLHEVNHIIRKFPYFLSPLEHNNRNIRRGNAHRSG